jgi:hypothetical protein
VPSTLIAKYASLVTALDPRWHILLCGVLLLDIISKCASSERDKNFAIDEFTVLTVVTADKILLSRYEVLSIY